jgi:hypothetical protein
MYVYLLLINHDSHLTNLAILIQAGNIFVALYYKEMLAKGLF